MAKYLCTSLKSERLALLRVGWLVSLEVWRYPGSLQHVGPRCLNKTSLSFPSTDPRQIPRHPTAYSKLPSRARILLPARGTQARPGQVPGERAPSYLRGSEQRDATGTRCALPRRVASLGRGQSCSPGGGGAWPFLVRGGVAAVREVTGPQGWLLSLAPCARVQLSSPGSCANPEPQPSGTAAAAPAGQPLHPPIRGPIMCQGSIWPWRGPLPRLQVWTWIEPVVASTQVATSLYDAGLLLVVKASFGGGTFSNHSSSPSPRGALQDEQQRAISNFYIISYRSISS